MNEFTTEISDRICAHMNDDHADAVVLYAKSFGGLTNAEKASMLSIDALGMNLNVQVDGSTVPLRIEFDHTLANSEDAHQTLIAMVKQARTKVPQ